MLSYEPSCFEKPGAFAQLAPRLRAHLQAAPGWPEVGQYRQLVALMDTAPEVELPRFEDRPPPWVKKAGGYEKVVSELRCVPTRSASWHDLFNALVWLHYPRFKWAANAVQIAEMSSPHVDPRNGRTAVQSRAAQFDEGGVVLLVDDAHLLEPLQRLDWSAFFLEQRACFGPRIQCLVVGHALFESLREPFVGITAKALPMVVPRGQLGGDAARLRGHVDRVLAERLHEALRADRFLPLPILGVPGWHPEQTRAFYENPRYFRIRRQPEIAAAVPQALEVGPG